MAEFAKCRNPDCWFQIGKGYVSRHCHPVAPVPATTLAQDFYVSAVALHQPPQQFVDIVMSGFPDHTPPYFIEVENEAGQSINFGEWIKRADGQHVLRIKLKGN